MPGGLVATAALWVVSIPVLLLIKVHARISRYATVTAGMRGSQAGAIGLTLAVAWDIIVATTPTPFHLIVAGVAFALVAFTRVDVLLVLAGAGVLGLSTLLRGQ